MKPVILTTMCLILSASFALDAGSRAAAPETEGSCRSGASFAADLRRLKISFY